MNPSTVPALAAQVDALSRAGRLPAAEQACRTALRTNPRDAEAWRLLGLILVRMERKDEGLAAVRQAVACDPRQPETRAQLAELLRRADRLDEADAEVRAALQLAPGSPMVHHTHGLIHMARERFPEAEACFRQALRLAPGYLRALHSLGDALREQNRAEDSLGSLRQARAMDPGSAEIANSLGLTLGRLERIEEALAAFEEAVRLRPDYPKPHLNKGNLLLTQDRTDDALAAFRRALELDPAYVEAWIGQGDALVQKEADEEALESFRQAVRVRPNSALACFRLGGFLGSLHRHDEAHVGIDRALKLRPDYAEAFIGRANLFRDQERFDDALAAADQALRLRPTMAEAHFTRGLILHDMDRSDEAMTSFDRAAAENPRLAEAQWSRGLLHLRCGNFLEGWKGYEWRSKIRKFRFPKFEQPPWDGGPLHGRTLLIHLEQGVGDGIQFIRYARLARERGGTIIVQCRPEMVSLLSTCAGIDRVVSRDDPLPPFDCHAPLMSLPHLLQTTLETIPSQVPYLRAAPEAIDRWSGEMLACSGLRIGLAWQGNPQHSNDRNRSMPLAELVPLAGLPGVQLVSLQKGTGHEQIAPLADRLSLLDLGPRLADLADTAGVLCHLDLVISIDSAMAHLAGSMALPVLVLLPAVAEWRWMRDRDDSPWYPTMRLVRQKQRGDWAGVVQRVVEILGTWQPRPDRGAQPTLTTGEKHV